jgi:regulator of cell morphogenesis and NO signaling
MKKEELMLFPAMRRPSGGGLHTPIAQMRHNNHGERLQQMVGLTGGFALPEGHALFGRRSIPERQS